MKLQDLCSWASGALHHHAVVDWFTGEYRTEAGTSSMRRLVLYAGIHPAVSILHTQFMISALSRFVKSGQSRATININKKHLAHYYDGLSLIELGVLSLVKTIIAVILLFFLE